MQNSGAHPNPVVSYVITAVVIVIVLALRLRGMNRDRPLKIDRLWIVPAIYAVIVTMILVEFPPTPIGWVLCGVSLAVGAALGWQRGRMMRISVDPATQSLNQRASPAAILFIVVLIVVRMGARNLAQVSGSPFHLNALMLTDMLVSMALGLLAVQRLEMFLRARRLLDEARGAASAR
jgi:hypothetical protein